MIDTGKDGTRELGFPICSISTTSFKQIKLQTLISEALPFCKKELKTKHVAIDTKKIIHTFLKNFYHLSKLWQGGQSDGRKEDPTIS